MITDYDKTVIGHYHLPWCR